MKSNHSSSSFKKHATYSITLLLLFIIQTTPRFLEINGVKPNLIFGATIAVAMLEGEMTGAIYGIVGGILCDLAGYLVFGFNTVLLMISCVIIGILVRSLLMESGVIYFIYTVVTTLAILSLQFLFIYGIWRLETVERLYLSKVVYVTIYSAVLAPLVYKLYKWIFRHFNNN